MAYLSPKVRPNYVALRRSLLVYDVGLFVYLSVCIFVILCQFVCLRVSLYVCMSVWMSVSLSIYEYDYAGWGEKHTWCSKYKRIGARFCQDTWLYVLFCSLVSYFVRSYGTKSHHQLVLKRRRWWWWIQLIEWHKKNDVEDDDDAKEKKALVKFLLSLKPQMNI